MKSFKEYVESRNNHQFESGICQLLTPVLEGKISFDDLVEQVIVPTFALQPYAENEMDILDLLQEGMWDRFKNWIGGREKPQQPILQAKLVDDPRAIEQMIKHQLNPTLQKITTNLQKTAFQTGNRLLHQSAQQFQQRLGQLAQDISSRYVKQKEQLDKQRQVKSYRRDGLDDDGDLRLQTPEEEAALRNRPAPVATPSPAQHPSMQNMTPEQRARLQRRMAQRNNNRSNVIGGVGRSQNSFGNAATA